MKILMFLFLFVIVLSCGNNKTKRNIQYMPDMYQSEAYEPYSASETSSIKYTALNPVEGTIPRGYVPYEIPNTNEGYELSKSNKSPLENSNLDENKKLYTIYCSVCHGENGDGQGILVKNGKFFGVPSYSEDKLPEITEGSVFHVVTYGKGVMGSHASQLSIEERWKVVDYVMKLRKELK